METFSNLGRRNELSKELNKKIKKFIYAINGYTRLQSVDQVRKELFVRKFEQEGKTTDLSLLPPCASDLNLHTKRANYIERISKKAYNLMMNLDDPTFHGWDGNYQAVWDENFFPEDLSELLIEEEKDGDDDAELEYVRDDSDYDDFDSYVGSDSEIHQDLFI